MSKSWRSIAPLIFKSNKWVDELNNKGLLAWLVGADLTKFRSSHDRFLSDCSGWKNVVLLVPEEDDIVRHTRELFFECLQSYEYIPQHDIVQLRDHKISIHISALRGDEQTYVPDPECFFRYDQSQLSTCVLACSKGQTTVNIGPERIGGLCEGCPTRMEQVKQVCSFRLHYRNGSPIWASIAEYGLPQVLGTSEIVRAEGQKEYSCGHCSFRLKTCSI